MLNEHNLQTVPGLPQLFYKQGDSKKPNLIIAKVVDDLLLAGDDNELAYFRESISKRFKVGRFVTDTSFVFYRLHINQGFNFDLEIDMQEYMNTITPINILRDREKEKTKHLLLQKSLSHYYSSLVN